MNQIVLIIVSAILAVAGLAVVFFVVKWLIVRPVASMTEYIKLILAGKAGPQIGLPSFNFFRPLAEQISKMSKSLSQARLAASEEARLRLEKIDAPWTAERLKEFIKAYLKNRKIFVISNREPYVHKRINGKIAYSVPASGAVTALEPVMEACGGLWLAYGSGDADKLTVDAQDKIQVPPDEPKYTLKRVWLTDEEVKGYYTGFSNEALWPLCHMAHTRPIFRKEDWQEYRHVNGKFAQSLLSEIKGITQPLVLVQDFHFAPLSQMIKQSRPDAQVSLFWHIPWPSAESFSICPWRKEIVEGMLGADILGFQTQQHCNNFMDTVKKEIESLVDLEQFSVTHEKHTTHIKPFPISIAFTNGLDRTQELQKTSDLLEGFGIKTKLIGLGVDRLDYIKGIPERFTGIEFFFKQRPEYKGQITFLQIAPPSREGVEKYRQFNREVTLQATQINEKFATNDWQPIVLVKENLSHEDLDLLYRRAAVCLVTSLHDGMNLVAKEFVAARNDESGVLVLSQFTGASRDLKGAININPYSAEQTSTAIYEALTMPPTEQRRRMQKMREAVKNYNVYRWSAELIKATTSSG
jgi:trehalose-6-phosphate synthase